MGKSKLSDEIGQFVGIPVEFIEASADLSDHARWLFVLLRFYTNGKTGDAFPSYDEIQRITGWHRKHIAPALRELMTAGWIERKRRFGASSIYRLKRPDTISSPVCTNDETAISSPVGTDISTPVGTTLVHTGGTLTRLNFQTESTRGSRVSDETRAPAPSASKNTTPAVAEDTPTGSEPVAPPAPPTTWEDVEAAPVEARRQARKWTDEHLDWYDALVRVTTGWTRVEFEGRKSERIQKRYHAAAKRLREAGYHTTDLISHYERGGWWWTDHWLGKERGEWPTVETIEDTWGDWLKSPVAVEAPAPKYPAYNPMPEDQRIPIPQTAPFWFLPGEIRAS